MDEWVAVLDIPDVIDEDKPKLFGMTAVAVPHIWWYPGRVRVAFQPGTRDADGAFVPSRHLKLQERQITGDAYLALLDDAGDWTLAGVMKALWGMICEEEDITEATA